MAVCGQTAHTIRSATRHPLVQSRNGRALLANRRDNLDRQQAQGWGVKVIDQLARDLTATFPDITGFTRLNFLYVRSFAEKWPEPEFVQQTVTQWPWGQ